jgi:Asp-tRNA(Asn)/Glu-tRNA(Gln) amidotransferase A subunit family amidase
MALSWSMDKLGPICRSATDAALVLAAIHGRDANDPTSVTLPLEVPGTPDVEGWVVGFVEADFAQSAEHTHVLEELEALGVDLVPIELPDYPVGDMTFVLSAEAASAFDELTRSNRDDELVRQERRAWPNVFRAARMIPAAEYVRANRLRTLLTRDWEACLREVDAIVHPSFAGGVLTATNLTGHPTFVAPCGFRSDGTPFSVSFTARLHGDDRLLTLARAWQAATEHHERHPKL